VPFRLPVCTLFCKTLPIRDGYAPEVWHFDLLELLQRRLTTPSFLAKCVWEPRLTAQSSELWHGALFRQSPLFTFARFVADDGSVFPLGCDVALTDGRVGQLASLALDEKDHPAAEIRLYVQEEARELVLTDDLAAIDPSNMNHAIEVHREAKFRTLSQRAQAADYWCEQYERKGVRQSVDKAPVLPSRSIPFPDPPPDNLKVKRVMLDVYLDGYPALAK
jgi:hypothetical protein